MGGRLGGVGPGAGQQVGGDFGVDPFGQSMPTLQQQEEILAQQLAGNPMLAEQAWQAHMMDSMQGLSAAQLRSSMDIAPDYYPTMDSFYQDFGPQGAARMQRFDQDILAAQQAFSQMVGQPPGSQQQIGGEIGRQMQLMQALVNLSQALGGNDLGALERAIADADRAFLDYASHGDPNLRRFLEQQYGMSANGGGAFGGPVNDQFPGGYPGGSWPGGPNSPPSPTRPPTTQGPGTGPTQPPTTQGPGPSRPTRPPTRPPTGQEPPPGTQGPGPTTQVPGGGGPGQSSRSRALEVATTQIGVREATGNNDGLPAQRYANGANVPWCAAFVTWSFQQAGRPLPGNQRANWGCDYMMNQMKQNGVFHPPGSTPQAGDVIFFGDNADKARHVGIVERVDAGPPPMVHTVEGNAGNRVCRKSYPLNSPRITGYGRPE